MCCGGRAWNLRSMFPHTPSQATIGGDKAGQSPDFPAFNSGFNGLGEGA